MPEHIPEMLITKKSVLQMIPFSYTTLWAMTNSGEFPSPIVLNPGSKHKRIAWKLSEVEAWIASRPTGMGSGPAVEVHQRRTALAAERLTAGVAGDQFPSAREPVTATRPLTRAERLALVGGITVTEE